MKTTYFPCMADHAYSVAAAFTAFGLPAEVLPRSDQSTLTTALEFVRGRECLPCFMTTGDIVKKCREPGFDPAQARFFMPTSHGPCRMGQYIPLQKEVLQKIGMSEVEILDADEDKAYQLDGENAGDIRKVVWQAIVATDLLLKLRHEYRPYETVPGSTDEAYARSLAALTAAALKQGGEELVRAMESIARDFEALEVDRSGRRPLIAMVGELYVCQDIFSNNGFVREVENAGGEVLLTTFSDWLYYCDLRNRELSSTAGNYLAILGSHIQEFVERRWEHKLREPIAHLLRNPEEIRAAVALPAIRGHFDTMLGGEGVMTMARAVSYAGQGVDGILNVLPFSCMLGTIASGMAPRLRRDLMEMIPWLDVPFDGQEITNVRTRLGAFMHQSREYQRGREGATV